MSFWVRSFGVGVGMGGVVGRVGGGSSFWRLGGVVVKYFWIWIVLVRGGRRRGRKESMRRGDILFCFLFFVLFDWRWLDLDLFARLVGLCDTVQVLQRDPTCGSVRPL